MQAIEAEIRRAEGAQVTFVGSSLGGFYATWFAEKYDRRAALINPAIRPDLGLAAYLGPRITSYNVCYTKLLRARGDADLLLNDIDTGHHLGDRMLDLNARVHLDEKKLAVLVQEFERACTAVAELAAGLNTAFPDLVAQLRGQVRCRRFLDVV